MHLPELLRIKGFRDLWLGQAISQLGDSLYYVAFMFMAKEITGSNAVVGYVGAMECLPFLLFGAYAGVVADRFDRRKIMFLSDVACGLALLGYAAYAFTNPKPAVWTLLAVPFVLSTVRCFFMPAKTASIPALVPAKDLLKANALSAATFNVMFMLGLAVSAGVIAKIYSIAPQTFFGMILLMNGLSFLGSAVYIRRLPALRPEGAPEHIHALDDFKSGLRFIANRPDLKAYIALMTAFRFGVGPFFVVYVATNKQWFDGKPATLMWFEFAFFAGMIVGSAWVAKTVVRRPGMLFSLALAFVGLTIAGMAFGEGWLWGFVLLNVLAGVAVPFADVPMLTYLQSSVVDDFRGRVNSVREMISVGVMPISMVAAGTMVESIGLQGAYLIMGGIMVAGCLFGVLSASFRNIRMPEAKELHFTERSRLVNSEVA